MDALTDILAYAFWVLLAITILVFVHEMGHFLFAKLFGMRVDRFSIGFPPRIFGKKIGETEYVIGATPLGGYVKIAGMVDESMDAEFEASEPQPWEFRSKPVWQRIVVITAGVVFNVLLACFIFIGLKYVYGESYIPAENVRAVYVEEGSLAYEMGLRTGDRIVAVSGTRPERFSDLLDVQALLADPFTITVERNGETITFQGPDDIITQLNRSQGSLGISFSPSLVGGVMPGSAAEEAGLQRWDRVVRIGEEPVQFWQQMTEMIQRVGRTPVTIRWERPDSLVQQATTTAQVVARRAGVTIYEAEVVPQYYDPEDRYLLGVTAPDEAMLAQEFGVRHKDYGLGEAIRAGLVDTWVNTRATAVSLGRVFSGRENLRENLGGPIMVAQVTKQAAEAGARSFWFIVAMLSITLAIVNILPIPALDGGHLVFLLYEGITRREPSLRVRMAMQQIGMILLLAFMTFLIFNDILRL
ncbi:RIP metalloprotease RseP [Rhodothermaceae bacterium RA]|nr:RIP metalloprotease RseP [Rhodothermaceae bacterium RA]